MIDWDLLKLDAETASARDVKRAYAKLLRQFRPEKDPEGFERLHQTYTMALNHVKWRELEQSPISSPDDEPISVLTEEPQKDVLEGRSDLDVFPPELEQKAERVCKTVRSDDAEKLANSIQVLDQALAEFPNALRIWENILGLIQEDDQKLFLNAITSPVLLREMAGDHCTLSLQTIDFWVSNTRFDELRSLAREIKGGKKIFANESTGQVTAALAEALSIMSPELAEDMLDFSFEWLPISDRQWRLPMLESRIMFGSPFALFQEDLRRFWATSLSSPENNDWESTESRDAVLQLLDRFDPEWNGYQTLSHILPADLLLLIEKRRDLQREDTYLAAEREKKKSKAYGCCAWLFGAFMLKILFSGIFSSQDSSEHFDGINGREMAELVAESRRRDLASKANRSKELALLLGHSPRIKELEEKAPIGPEVIAYLQEAQTHPDLATDMAYETFLAYTFLYRADESSTEALLRCLSHEKAIEYLATYRDLLKSGSRLLVRIQLNRFLTEEGASLDEVIKSKLIRLRDDYITPEDVISPIWPRR